MGHQQHGLHPTARITRSRADRGLACARSRLLTAAFAREGLRRGDPGEWHDRMSDTLRRILALVQDGEVRISAHGYDDGGGRHPRA
jgi:hypothetical protein